MDREARARDIADGLRRGTGLTLATVATVRDDAPMSAHTRAVLVVLGLLVWNRRARTMERAPIWRRVAELLKE